MDILADENLDRLLVAWLRGQGHDVVWMAESSPGKTDDDVLAQAVTDDRVVLTFDLDFGDLVYRLGRRAAGIVLLRFRSQSAAELLQTFVRHWPMIEKHALGHFIVVSNSRLRIRPIP